MVNDIGFQISEEDSASESETRLDHSELLCGSFITVKKDKASDIDIRRGTESAPLISLIKALYTFTRPSPTIYILN